MKITNSMSDAIVAVIASGLLIGGFIFIYQTYAQYLPAFLSLSILYFMVAALTMALITRISGVTMPKVEIKAPVFSSLGRRPFSALAAFYLAIVSLIFAIMLFLAGHMARGWLFILAGYFITTLFVVPHFRKRTATAMLAILFGWLGIHKFYLDRSGWVYVLFFWTFIPTIVSVIEGMRYLLMSDETFAGKYAVQGSAAESTA